jgi:hypothetical protein
VVATNLEWLRLCYIADYVISQLSFIAGIRLNQQNNISIFFTAKSIYQMMLLDVDLFHHAHEQLLCEIQNVADTLRIELVIEVSESKAFHLVLTNITN